MKPLTLEETRLKEEMKSRCLAKGQYVDENAKKKFDMLCHLEDFEIQYWELQQENKQLKDNWNKLKEYLHNVDVVIDYSENYDGRFINYDELIDKIQEIEQGSDSNE